MNNDVLWMDNVFPLAEMDRGKVAEWLNQLETEYPDRILDKTVITPVLGPATGKMYVLVSMIRTRLPNYVD